MNHLVSNMIQMLDYSSLRIQLGKRLDEVADLSAKEWWQKYLKNVIEFRGVNLAGIKKQITKLEKEDLGRNLKIEEWKKFAFELFNASFSEDKMAGIVILQEKVPVESYLVKDLENIATVFQSGLIYDWNLCDWMFVRVINKLAGFKKEFAVEIASWKNSDNLWQRRASCVSFVYNTQNIANKYHFWDSLIDVCTTCIKHQERFSQTGTAWLLRELSRIKTNEIIHFLEQNFQNLSLEALKSSTKYFDKNTAKNLTQKWKNLNNKN
jgi:hypothetical protein